MAGGKTVAAEQGAWLCFEDEAGQTLRPPKARTWGRRGHTPQVPVSGKGSGRVSVAGLVCVRPGQRSRLIYRTLTHRGRKGERRSFSEAGYAALLDAAHQQLGGPIVLIWDNLNTHVSAAMRELIAARDWLHVIRLPAYAVRAENYIHAGQAAARGRERHVEMWHTDVIHLWYGHPPQHLRGTTRVAPPHQRCDRPCTPG